jgi:hypothetical protein
LAKSTELHRTGPNCAPKVLGRLVLLGYRRIMWLMMLAMVLLAFIVGFLWHPGI